MSADRGERFEVNEHRLYVEQDGPVSGKKVVLLHHRPGSVPSWKCQVSAFADAVWRVIADDRRGDGSSESCASFGLDFLYHEADAVMALFDIPGIESAQLVRHSDGGTIALILASGSPHRTGKVSTAAARIYFKPQMLEG